MRASIFLLLCLPLAAQFRLYTCMVTSRGYVVGAPLPPSGIFQKPAGGAWEHIGYAHPFVSALDYDPRDPSTLYLAAGNGLIRATDRGRTWKILTSYDVTELRDLAVDRNAPGTIYFAHTAGIRVSRDGGATWQAADRGIRRKYTEAIRVDRSRAGHLVAGTEDGLFYSVDGGPLLDARRRGRISGPAHRAVAGRCRASGSPSRRAAACSSPATAGRASRIPAASGSIAISTTSPSIPPQPGRIALGGWGVGVLVTEDGGKTWQSRNAGLPRPDVWSVAFDPAKPGRLYASVHEEALYVSDDSGADAGARTAWRAAWSAA